jgi:nucleoside-diphosphate-sugar epimerase
VHLVIGGAGHAGRHAAAAIGEHVRVRTAEVGDDLARAMRGVEVVHLAVEVRSPLERPRRERRSPPHPFLVALVDAARAAGVRRLVCLSSAQALGFTTDGRVSERTPARPEHPYERLLAADEAWLRDQYQPDVVLLRPAQGFGLGEPVLSCLVHRMATGRLPLPGGGRARRTFLASADLGQAFHAAALRGQSGAAYLLGGFLGSWWDLLDAAAEALSVRSGLARASYDVAYLAASVRSLGVPLGRQGWQTPFLVDLLGRPQVVEDGWTRRELSWAPAVGGFRAGLLGLADWYWTLAPRTSVVASRSPEVPGPI